MCQVLGAVLGPVRAGPHRQELLWVVVRLGLAPSPQSSFSVPVALQVWGATLENSTAHSCPGRPARLHSWSYWAQHPGGWEGRRRGQRHHWGSLGGLPGPASFLLIRPSPAGGVSPSLDIGAQRHRVTQTLKLKYFGGHMPPKWTQGIRDNLGF